MRFQCVYVKIIYFNKYIYMNNMKNTLKEIIVFLRLYLIYLYATLHKLFSYLAYN